MIPKTERKRCAWPDDLNRPIARSRNLVDSEPDPTKRGECFAVKHINVSAAFFVSIEFQQTGYLVHRFYTASYPAGASRPHGLPRLSEFLTDTQTIGRGVVVGAAGWEQGLRKMWVATPRRDIKWAHNLAHKNAQNEQLKQCIQCEIFSGNSVLVDLKRVNQG
jgi:hypothetical protein